MSRLRAALLAALAGVVAMVGLTPAPLAAQDIPAFPGAYDNGASALNGCRNGLRIVKVTNGNSSGPGSYAAALALADDDTLTLIVYPEGVKIDGSVSASVKCLYDAGQTAQGGGVEQEGRIRLNKTTEDAVFRYRRVSKVDGHGFLIFEGHDIILDHITSRWNGYGLQIGGDTSSVANASSGCVRRVTLQNSMVYEQYGPTINHAVGVFLGGVPASEPCTDSISVVGNLIKDNSHRNFADQGNYLRGINNLVANWNQGATHFNGQFSAYVVRNHFQTGPMTQSGRGRGYEIGSADPSSPVYCATWEGGDATCTKQLYAEGNIGPHNPSNPNLSNDASWRGENRQISWYNFSDDEVEISQKSTVPTTWSGGPWPWPTRSDIRLYADTLLATVGASQRRDCGTGWVTIRDTPDAAEVAEWYAKTGVPSYADLVTKATNVSVPSVTAGTACADTDEDGLPDEWEVAVFGSIAATNAPDSITVSGYFVAEHWVNNTDPGATLDELLAAVGVPVPDPDPEPEPGELRRRTYVRDLVEDARGRLVPDGVEGALHGYKAILIPGTNRVFVNTVDSLTTGDPELSPSKIEAECADAEMDCDAVLDSWLQPEAMAPARTRHYLLAAAWVRRRGWS